ncbi:MAG: uroporphyrinogen-III synthase [Aquificaceae bacterium]|nr:uroporphyrinogen-III synthase [Aquificaceae bacterium]MCS7277872.1 uroporphyrinogen-III synthase [Aquificaceae bacterium]MDW8066542.1 uroporphyrinogen-III synthase [Aquificaceae bacterium]MDW8423317.1 uroporphyrinogen-III synthase [Aquificaceae bacterium]
MRVALTRTQEDIDRDKHLFEREGFEVVPLPLIEEVALEFKLPEESFDFVIFQSPRAVRFFLSRYKLKGEKVVVVGEKTKEEVEKWGYSVWAMPENYYGRELLELFKGLSGRVLIPKSAVGRDEVIEGLKNMGFSVYPLSVYTVKEVLYKRKELLKKLHESHVVVFASPSAVKALIANLQKEDARAILKEKKLICIGKTTKEFLREELSLDCLIPEKPTMESVVNLLKSRHEICI